MNNSRWKNYALWLSIASAIPLILSSFGIHIIPNYTEIVNSILTILVLAGIINNPTTNCKWYLDDKQASPTDKSNDTNK